MCRAADWQLWCFTGCLRVRCHQMRFKWTSAVSGPVAHTVQLVAEFDEWIPEPMRPDEEGNFFLDRMVVYIPSYSLKRQRLVPYRDAWVHLLCRCQTFGFISCLSWMALYEGQRMRCSRLWRASARARLRRRGSWTPQDRMNQLGPLQGRLTLSARQTGTVCLCAAGGVVLLLQTP